jgi:hypothetical protein
MQEKELDAAREAIKDSITVIEKLSPHCASFDELKGILQHAVENDAQLRLLMATIKPKGQK